MLSIFQEDNRECAVACYRKRSSRHIFVGSNCIRSCICAAPGVWGMSAKYGMSLFLGATLRGHAG